MKRRTICTYVSAAVLLLVVSQFATDRFGSHDQEYTDDHEGPSLATGSKIPRGGPCAHITADSPLRMAISARANQILADMDPRNAMASKRFACHTAAEELAPGIAGRSDPRKYFGSVLSFPDAFQKASDEVGKKPHYKLGYVMMVHTERDADLIFRLVDRLDDEDAFVLLHVDLRSHRLFEKVNAACAGRQNVHITARRGRGHWGHISLVFIHISAMLELLSLTDVDYMINLSARDYPLLRNYAIHQQLQSITNDTGKDIFIHLPGNDGEAEKRFRSTWLLKPDGRGIANMGSERELPRALRGGLVVKQHQWMVISPAALQSMLESGEAMNILAYAEFSYIPDESYFATTLVNSPQLRERVHRDNFRYLRFAGGAHPVTLTMKDRVHFPPGGERAIHFVRKIGRDDKLVRWIDETHLLDVVGLSRVPVP
jgi:hypothetical protein